MDYHCLTVFVLNISWSYTRRINNNLLHIAQCTHFILPFTANESVFIQTIQKLQALEAKLEQQLANITTSSGSSIPWQIPATIDINTCSGSSTPSTIMKEKMMQMCAKFTQNLQQGQCTVINPTGTKVTGKEKKKRKLGTNYIPNNLGGEQQSKRRYPESTSYCPPCG